MDRGAWWAAVHGVARSRTRLPFHFSLSCIGEGNGNPPQCSCLENPRNGGAWWAAVCGVAQSRTRLKRLSSRTTISFLLSFHLELFVIHDLMQCFLELNMSFWNMKKQNCNFIVTSFVIQCIFLINIGTLLDCISGNSCHYCYFICDSIKNTLESTMWKTKYKACVCV